MATRIGIGFSSTNNPVEACKAAAIEAKTSLNTVKANAVVVCASAGHITPEGIAAIQKILQPERLVGTTTSGIIANDKIEPRGVGVLAVISDELHFAAASLEQINLLPARETGYKFARALLKEHGPGQRSAGLYFYSGARYDGSALQAGLHEGLGNALPVAGAAGVESPATLLSQQICGARIMEDAVAGLIIGGAGIAAAASRHSWQPLGKPRTITAANGNIIITIDKEPAINLYKNYFNNPDMPGMQAIGDIRLLYPLGISTNQPREYLIRNPIDILEDGSIVFQGDMPTERKVHLMITNKDACRQSASDAAHELREKMLGKPPKLIIILESLVRHKILGRADKHNLQAIHEIFGHHIPIFGMHTFAETAPLRTPQSSTATHLANGSISLLAIG